MVGCRKVGIHFRRRGGQRGAVRRGAAVSASHDPRRTGSGRSPKQAGGAAKETTDAKPAAEPAKPPPDADAKGKPDAAAKEQAAPKTDGKPEPETKKPEAVKEQTKGKPDQPAQEPAQEQPPEETKTEPKPAAQPPAAEPAEPPHPAMAHAKAEPPTHQSDAIGVFTVGEACAWPWCCCSA